MKCANCNLTCHDKCKSKVQLNCTAFERPKSPISGGAITGNGSSGSSSSSSSEKDLSTLAGISTIIDEEAFDETDEGKDRSFAKVSKLLHNFQPKLFQHLLDEKDQMKLVI